VLNLRPDGVNIKARADRSNFNSFVDWHQWMETAEHTGYMMLKEWGTIGTNDLPDREKEGTRAELPQSPQDPADLLDQGYKPA